jgi:hypothetical protein
MLPTEKPMDALFTTSQFREKRIRYPALSRPRLGESSTDRVRKRTSKSIFMMQNAPLSNKQAVLMDHAARWLQTAAVASALLITSTVWGQDAAIPVQASAKLPPVPVEEGKIDMEQIREELGVNSFTAPPIDQLLAELMDFRPIPIEKVWKDFKPEMPQDRALLAMASGRAIADGLLSVIAEKPSRVEPCARALMRYAKGLGVADHVTKHSKSVLEKAAKESWGDVRRELVRAQADVEAGMLALKDEEIAHLVSLGGWLRGIEVVAAIIAEDYSPERAKRLVQPEALAYFADRVSTLNPRLRKNELFVLIDKNLKSIRDLAGKEGQPAPSEETVKTIRKLAGEVVDQL